MRPRSGCRIHRVSIHLVRVVCPSIRNRQSGTLWVLRNRFCIGLLLAVLGVISLAHAQEVRYIYDDLNRLVGVVDPQGNAAEYVYDAVGNILQIKRFDVPPGASLAITLVTPSEGSVGTQVQLFGKGFSATLGDNQVRFNGTAATITAATTTSLTTAVPSGATTGPLMVTTPLGVATAPEPFTVLQGFVVVPDRATVFLGEDVRLSGGPRRDADQRRDLAGQWDRGGQCRPGDDQ